jgi:hypothetical protein
VYLIFSDPIPEKINRDLCCVAGRWDIDRGVNGVVVSVRYVVMQPQNAAWGLGQRHIRGSRLRRLSENLKNRVRLRNAKRIRDSASADHVAGTNT